MVWHPADFMSERTSLFTRSSAGFAGPFEIKLVFLDFTAELDSAVLVYCKVVADKIDAS